LLNKEEIKSLFEKKQYSEVLKGAKDTPYLLDYLGFLYLESGDYLSAEKFFAEQKMYYQQGLCMVLRGDKVSARKLWYSVPEDTAIAWGKVFLGIFEQKLEAIPTFLQVRNFLETTLNYLFRANQIDFAYKLIGAKEFFADCNIESYKYIARVMMDNNLEGLAYEYLQKAIDVIPQDYEAYFHLGELYVRQNKIDLAIKAYKRVVEINSDHTPAFKILKKLEIDNK